MGLEASATGAVFITGGLLTVTNGVLGVGNNGPGRVAVSNGLVEAVSILVGDNFNGDSGLTVAGSGQVRSRGGLRANLTNTFETNAMLVSFMRAWAKQSYLSLFSNAARILDSTVSTGLFSSSRAGS